MKTFTLALVAVVFGMTGFAYAGGSTGAAAAQAPTLMSDAQMANTVAGYTPSWTETYLLFLPAVQFPDQPPLTVGDVYSARPTGSSDELPAVQSVSFFGSSTFD